MHISMILTYDNVIDTDVNDDIEYKRYRSTAISIFDELQYIRTFCLA